jgi:hypothetical protein
MNWELLKKMAECTIEGMKAVNDEQAGEEMREFLKSLSEKQIDKIMAMKARSN